MIQKVKRLPAEVFHPAEYIRDELEAREWTVEQFAIMAELRLQETTELVASELRVTPRLAIHLGCAFGTSATVWYRLQRAFDAGTPRGKP